MDRKAFRYKGLIAFASGRRKSMNSVSRWHYFLYALGLALVMLSTGQTWPAQAAPAGENVRFYMDVAHPKTTLCTGQTVTYTVHVYRQFTSPPPGWTDKNFPASAAIQNVKVEAYPADKNIGFFHGPQKAGIVSDRTGFNFDGPDSVEFQFTAGKKPGKTNLYFEGAVPGYTIQTGYVSFTVPIRVIRCNYEVSTHSTWVLKSQYGTGFAFEFMKATLTADDLGYFTSSPDPGVLWVTVNQIPNTKSVIAVYGGKAKLNGQVDENGLLNLKINFNTAAGEEANCNAVGCGGGAVAFTPQPLMLNFPEAGGTKRAAQVLDSPAGPLPGTTTVTVIPLEQKP